MAKISLRNYNRDIESLIEQGQLDEAIAHCRHILNIYPKHLETYRMLGKAYLEAKRYAEAVDIFQRLLNAVPDDFVAHVGMSIICDEQNKLDDAIWHMERAYEVQPSNSAIQAELQRLYGRRDGVEPPKIRLTRGALAHMYMHGELYPQAISEIKKVLDEDPNRQDMLTLLARAYFHAGQKTESAEVCEQLLRRYAYCLDANRVLVELLTNTEGAQNTQVYRQRVNEMEPYAAFARESIFRFEDVPDAAVSLERLDWNGQPVQPGPAWSQSLELGLEGPPAFAGEQPDWLRAGLAETPPAASLSDEQPAPVSSDDSQLPDFLRQAGWSESSGELQETPSAFEAEAAPPLAAADLPDWVKAMAPSAESQTPSADQPIDLPTEELPDWLREVNTGEAAPEAKPFEQTDLRSWLPPEKIEEDAAAAAGLGALAGVQDEGRLSDEAAVPAVPPAAGVDTGRLGASAAEQDDALAWLEGLAAKHGAKPEELLTKPEERRESEPEWVQQAKSLGVQTGQAAEIPFSPAEEWREEPAPETPLVEEPASHVSPAEEPLQDDLPDFLKEVMRAQGEIPPAHAPSASSADMDRLGASAAEQDDALAWLEGLAAKHGAKPEELLTKPEERRESEPDWVLRAKERGESRPAEEAPAAPLDETGLWLRDLEAQGQPPAAQADEQPASQPQEGLPDWLSGMEGAPAAAETVLGGEEESWRFEQGVLPSEEERPLEPSPSDLPDWLSGMEGAPAAAETVLGGEEETLQFEQGVPPSEEEQPPDWLRALEAETASQPTEEKVVTDLPDWLAGLDEEKPPKQAPPPAETLPDWLREEGEGAPVSLEPVRPADWTPVEEAPPAEPSPPSPPVEKPASPSYRETVTRSRSGMTGMLSMTRDLTLSQAQAELSRGNIPAAMEIYGKLIKKGRLLDEVIFDLREALYRYPIEVIIWQALGDAYLRANRLQDSLDAYTKAEELLR